MKERTIYIADDDMEFDSMADCEAHETEINASKFIAMFDSGDLVIYNNKFEKLTAILIPSTTFRVGYESALETAMFLHIGTQEAYDALYQHGEDMGLQIPAGLGDWMYDYNDYEWHEINTYYRDTVKEIDFCRSVGFLPKAE